MSLELLTISFNSNNADKDFLKKVKDIHPTLTNNDLREINK